MIIALSSFLTEQKPKVKELVKLLSDKFSYVSVLGTDTIGKQYSVQRTGISINDSMWSERGFVIRVYNGANYSEFSFNTLLDQELENIVEHICTSIEKNKAELSNSTALVSNYPIMEEPEVIKSFFSEVQILPEEVSSEEKIRRMTTIKDKAFELSDLLIDFRVNYEEVKISKIFISNKKDLEQAYVWSQGAIVAIVRRDNTVKYCYDGFSGLKAVELLDEMEQAIQKTVENSIKLLDSQPVEPGEYDVICSPEISGLIAHEAFGHGVEMDMFVKGRAKAVEYIDKPVASTLVTMHDGAASAVNMSSYLFDDEGTLGTDTVIIENGILKRGISDILSALKLGTTPTGNGKRQSFERKAYTRMTNTFFAPGNDKLEDMITSIKSGYILEYSMSGMEDPKNWGIQCMILQGREIVEGKLTGKIVSPVIMTGYVPDLLKSITMVSEKVELFGTGACGKGYKEFVKVSDGGPYIKARVRLG